jgi:hypothetical protein
VTTSPVTVDGSGANGTATLSVSGNKLVLTVARISTYLALASSNPTNGYKDSVTFTAAVQTNSVTAGNVTGNVVFYYSTYGTNSPLAFSTNSLSAGLATSLSISNQLPRGTNLITVEYSGDGNYLGFTSSIIQTVTNHPPVALNVTNVYNAGASYWIFLTNLTAQAKVLDVDGDTVTLAGAGAGTNSGTTVLVETNLLGGVVSFSNTNNVNDRFSYTVTDGYDTGTGTLYMVMSSVFGQSNPVITTVGTTNVIKFYGIPNYSYSVWRDSAVDGAYTNIATISSTNGVIIFMDTNPLSPSGFYKLSYP